LISVAFNDPLFQVAQTLQRLPSWPKERERETEREGRRPSECFWLKGISRFWLFQWRLSGVSQKLAQLVYDRFCRLRCRRIHKAETEEEEEDGEGAVEIS